MIRWILSLFITSAMAQSNTVYIDQVGTLNNISVVQDGTGSKSATIETTGDLNNFSITQQHSGSHTASIQTNAGVNNNANNITINQSNSGNHSASVLLQNNSSSNLASITQAGAAPKSFNLTLDGSQINVTVIQDNPLIPDVGSMTIQCLTPPCNGFSYIRR